MPVSAGDAIRLEVRSSPFDLVQGVDVESTRPLVLFSFLDRFLRREGFATKFLFDSPGGGDTLYELPSGFDPLDAAEDADASDRGGDGAGGEGRGECSGDRGEGSGDGEDKGERRGDHDAERESDRGQERDGERDGEQGAEIGLLEVPRSDVDRWVNVCFGARRDGVDHEPVAPSERVMLSSALERFGHPAVALYLLGTHYSLPLGDTLKGLAVGCKNAARIREGLGRLVPDQPSPPDMRHYIESFRDALADDLDTPSAFVVMFEWLLEAERRGGEVGDNDLRVMLEVLELEDLAAPVR